MNIPAKLCMYSKYRKQPEEAMSLCHNLLLRLQKKDPVYCIECNNIIESEEQHKTVCPERLIICPECNETMPFKLWSKHSCQKKKVEEYEEIISSYADILKMECLSDVQFIICETKFLLHKSILAARSQYFKSMFNSTMQESENNTVIVKDVEPKIFQIFVYYLYTGKIDEDLSVDQMIKLYVISDKYLHDDLRRKSMLILSKKIDVFHFFDIIKLAIKFNDLILKNCASNFFMLNAKEIINEPKWINFLTEETISANNLMLKLIE